MRGEEKNKLVKTGPVLLQGNSLLNFGHQLKDVP